MKAKYLILLIILLSLPTYAQVPRMVLMEYATNASCGPCAAANPGSYAFLKSNYGRMISIWYHAWWPGSGDPMYLANTAENENRIKYYNVNAVPRYIVDGILQGYGDESSKMRTDAESRFPIDSPKKLEVETDIVGDSIEVGLTLVVYGDVTDDNLKLQTVITEQMLVYSSPPGSNGEVDFPHVFRKFIGGVAGIDVSNLSIGDSLTFKLKDEINAEWNREQIAIVAFVQSQTSKEIIQSATDKKLHSISGNSPQRELVSKNQSIDYSYSIKNYQADTLKLSISLNVEANKQNWNTALKYNGNSVDTIRVSIAPQEVVNFDLSVMTNNIPDYLKVSIVAKNIDENSSYSTSVDYMVLVKAGDIMIIDDDGEKDFDDNFTRALTNNGKEYTKVGYEILNDVKDLFNMTTEYKTIIWNLGDHSPSLVTSDFTWILNYLNNGGRVLFSGSDFAHDIHDVQNLSTGKFFFRNYFDVNYLTDSVTSNSLSSVPGNPLFDTLNIQLNSAYDTYPDGVDSRNGESHMVMKFDGTDYYGIILRERNEYKTAYITFGLEQISTEANQDLVVEKILDWFATPVVGVDDKDEVISLPNDYRLEQNFPNPFNPATLINYQIPEAGNVKIIVYDILGNEVAELVNENKKAGSYSVSFNAGSKISSGIYFYSITSNSFYQVRKMLLLK
jgi:hypothetical protein